MIESDRVWNFLRVGVDRDVDAGFVQRRKQFSIKRRDRFCIERESPRATVRCSNLQPVLDEVELDFERSSPVWNGRSRQSSRAYIQRSIPPMILEWRKGQADFPDDLRPHVQRVVGVLPFAQRQRGPVLFGPLH